MQIVDRTAREPHFTEMPASGRPIRLFMLHNTRTPSLPSPEWNEWSWHYIIDRDATVYQDVADEDIAWCAGYPDQWYPPFVLPPPPSVRVSPINWCAIHIELVGMDSYTGEQYAALLDLLLQLKERHGAQPIIGHGQTQNDRSDPVGLEWRRIGVVPQESAQMPRSWYQFDPLRVNVHQAEIAMLREHQAYLDWARLAPLGQVQQLVDLLGMVTEPQVRADGRYAEAIRFLDRFVTPAATVTEPRWKQAYREDLAARR